MDSQKEVEKTATGEEQKEEQAKKPYPIEVEYCPHCGAPPEYCEYGPCFDKCKVFLAEKHPDILANVTPPKEPKKTEGEAEGKSAKGPEEEKKEAPAEVKPKKVNLKDVKQLIITKTARTKRKFLTVIQGLDKYGYNLKDAAKKIGKKFACGASVVAEHDTLNVIEVQGDIVDEIIEYIVKEFGEVKESEITVKMGKGVKE